MELLRRETAFFSHSFPHLPRFSMIEWRAVDRSSVQTVKRFGSHSRITTETRNATSRRAPDHNTVFPLVNGSSNVFNASICFLLSGFFVSMKS
jgi:hypothetical protein